MPLALVKLNNGVELLGDVKKTTAGINITDPLQINYKFVSFQPMPTVSVSRYMPFAAEPSFTFMLDQVAHVVEPKQTMAEYYIHALANYQQEIDAHIDDELMGVVGRSSVKRASNKEELYTALLERMESEGPLN
jgi:hypothetical protein